MTITTAIGTCVSVSAATPATHDEAGFAALAYTKLGTLASLGGINRTHGKGVHLPLCTGVAFEVKGGSEYSTQDLAVALDRADGAQMILSAAAESRVARVSIKTEWPDGIVDFMQCRVYAAPIGVASDANAVRVGSYTVGVYVPTDGSPAIVQASAGMLPPSLDSIAAFLDPSNPRAYYNLPYGTSESWNEAANGGELQRQAFDLEVPPGEPPAQGRPVVAYLHPAGSTKAVAPGSAVDVNVKQVALSGGEAFVSAWHRNPETNFNWDGANGVPVTDAALLVQQIRALATALKLDPNNILFIGSSKGNDYLTATFSGDLASPAASTYAGRQSSLPSAGYSINAQTYYDPGKWATKFVPPANQAAFLAEKPANPLMPNAAELIATCPVACLIPLAMVHDAPFVAYPNVLATTDIHFSGNATEALIAYANRGYANRITIWAGEDTAEGRLGTALPWWRNLRAGMSVRGALAAARARARGAALWWADAALTGMSQNADGSGPIAVDGVVGGIVDGSYGPANRVAVAGSQGFPLGQPGGTNLKPTLRAKGNGQYCIRFDATNDKLQTAYASDGTPNFRAWADLMYTTYISATTSTLQIGVGTTETALAGKDVSLMLAQNADITNADLRIYANFAQELSGVAYASQTP